MTQYHLRDDITPEEWFNASFLVARYYHRITAGAATPDTVVVGDEARAAVRALFREVEPEEHPESTCQRCGGPNMVWHAPSPLWNAVMRGPDGADRFGIVCPRCFATLAEELGLVEGSWCVTSHHILADLDYTDGTGRRWDKERCLWVNEWPESPTPPAESGEPASLEGWIQKVEAENDALRAEVARLREDGERMDWLQSLASYQTFPDGGSITHFATKDVHAALHASGGNLRAAIDAARSTPEGDNG